MVAYIVRRVIGAVLLLAITTMVTFGIFFLVPRLAGQTTDQIAAQYVGRDPSPEEITLTKRRLGLDDPLVVQYGRFVKGLVAGTDYSYGPNTEFCPPPCFGYSFKYQRAVWPDLVDRFPVTLSLAVGAAAIWLVAGVAIGVLSALRKGTVFDRAAMITALAGVSLPIFFTGLLTLAFIRPEGVVFVPFTENPPAWAGNLLLPWVTLAFLFAAGYARLTRATMLETVGEDYIRTARAKGLPERTVIGKHALRATMTPTLTMFGLDLGLLLGGAVLTESTYSLPGLGKYAVDAIRQNDLPQILGVTTLAAFFIVVANLVVDLLYAVVDPRVRLG
ncbi:ABC transporter permease [Bailinhaonella thermotolerans]|uniref:ABC transporter permease n=1 Tax=Bailinhaonella thermotolerans TaxID=1070861 RepID=A0A3A4BWQ5_9ACTN|nr:ABC transporter permease [Bailinhaonella thermotolerans]RJL36018.1 ABC transporter permease [Bailinhaonella thermotolerans]